MTDHLILDVAGLKIKLWFFPIDNVHMREVFIEAIKKEYSGFVSKSASGKVALNIEFRETVDIEIIYRKAQRTYYYESIRYKNSNTVETYYRIGPAMFSFILKQLLLRIFGAHKCLMIHTSSVLIDGKAYLFMAHSGGGKSTIMKFLTHKYESLADDSVIIKKEGGKYYFYQTPMVEKEWWIKKNSKRYELGGLYFINKAKVFEEKEIGSVNEKLLKLMDQLLVSDLPDKRPVKLLMKFIGDFRNIKNLYFAKDRDKLLQFFSNKTNGR